MKWRRDGSPLPPPGEARRHDLSDVPVARSPVARFLGLMGRRERDGLFLLIPRCRSVHTCFMRSRIDIAFLDRDAVVIDLRENVDKWRIYQGPPRTRAVLELPPGQAHRIGLMRGDEVICNVD